MTPTLALAFGGATVGGCTASEPAAPRGAPVATATPAAPAATPTWFRDVEPLVARACAGCHIPDGTGGFPLDQVTATSLASLIAERVSARDMPPWPPSAHGAPLAASRALDGADIATFAAWTAAGAPAGDPRDRVARSPRAAGVPIRDADLRLELAVGESYQAPASPFVTDEVRCFALELPAGREGLWVSAARWHAETPRGVRSLSGIAIGAKAAAVVRAWSGRDGRAGFDCGSGLGDLAVGSALGASGTGGRDDVAMLLPGGTAVRIPSGGAVVMRVHHAVKHLAGASAREGVELWLADEVARRRVRPLVPLTVSAPVEVPCPSGVSTDPSSACSRDNAFQRLAGADAERARARADALLTTCGTDLTSAARGTAIGDHLYVTTSCARTAPFEGTLRAVRAHLQTRGASVRIEVEQSDGVFRAALDIPRWRWGWEGTYVLERGLPVPAGKRIRVSCTFDNGTSNQWSALTGEPGHDLPARPPQLAPGYLIAAPNRAAEACTAVLDVERAPYRGEAWPTLCHEAQAIHQDACGVGKDLVSRGCTPADEDASVEILAMTSRDLLCASP